jgi:hypothetical protein
MNSQPSLRQLVQYSPIEYVCLNCTLPECDESLAGCIYRQARAEKPEKQAPKPRQRDREYHRRWYRLNRHSEGNRCPDCGQPITNHAARCRKCARRARTQ